MYSLSLDVIERKDEYKLDWYESNCPILRNYFNLLGNCETTSIRTKEDYEEFISWIEKQLSIKCIDIQTSDEAYDMYQLIMFYREVKDLDICFDTQYIEIEHDW